MVWPGDGVYDARNVLSVLWRTPRPGGGKDAGQESKNSSSITQAAGALFRLSMLQWENILR